MKRHSAALDCVGQRIEAPGGVIGGRVGGVDVVRDPPGSARRNRCLLDHLAIMATVRVAQDVPNDSASSTIDRRSLPSAFSTRSRLEHAFVEVDRDQVIFRRARH